MDDKQKLTAAIMGAIIIYLQTEKPATSGDKPKTS